MVPYKRLNPNSGITAYEIKPDSIKIEFDTGGLYLYDYRAPGREHVEKMKELAVSGVGLCTYIIQQVRENYATKLK